MKMPPKSLTARLKKIKIIIFDVDGVLTTGAILVHPDGSESKDFHVRDGIAIRLAQRAGLKIGLLSGRHSEAVAQRALDLGVEICIQGVSDKKAAFLEIIDKCSLKPEEAAYVGDDIVDLPVLRSVGFAAATLDSCAEAKEAAHFVTQTEGGRGVAREIIELILKSQNLWNQAIQQFLK